MFNEGAANEIDCNDKKYDHAAVNIEVGQPLRNQCTAFSVTAKK